MRLFITTVLGRRLLHIHKVEKSQFTNFQFKFQFEVISSHENQAQNDEVEWMELNYMITTVSSQKREEA